MPDESAKPPPATGPVEVGRRLRQRRAELGLSLAEVEAATKIRARYLAAIEAGEAGALPGPVYAAGFVRAFADCLGLDGGACLEAYRASPPPDPSPAVPSPPGPPPAAPPAPVHPQDLDLAPAPRTARFSPRRALESRRAPPRARMGNWLVVATLVLVLMAGVYAALLPGLTTPPADPAPGPGDPGTGGGGPVAPPPPPVMTRDRIATAEGAAGQLLVTVDWTELAVTLVAGDRVWLRAVRDGQQVTEGIFEAGATVVLAAADRIEVRTGRAVHTRIIIGGVDIGPAGERDTPRTLVIVRRQ